MAEIRLGLDRTEQFRKRFCNLINYLCTRFVCRPGLSSTYHFYDYIISFFLSAGIMQCLKMFLFSCSLAFIRAWLLCAYEYRLDSFISELSLKFVCFRSCPNQFDGADGWEGVGSVREHKQNKAPFLVPGVL